ncbi:MAG: cation:proton antiporter subunit C [Hyphomonadaceae bacterium]|nr:cation:proton antiporter subunit C [Hyphomonadaceae bacterium]MBC6411523.1 cation:proton antiporter subunit C [Hyphomonadaceae bacterium]
MLGTVFDNYHYAVVIILMMTGLYTVFASGNLIKKLVGLSVFQTSVFLMYITIGKVMDAQPPILEKAKDYALNVSGNYTAAAGESGGGGYQFVTDIAYSNPLPHVLILTAIVVGVATLAIGLALVVRIREVYGTIEEDEISAIDYGYNLEGTSR